MGISILVDLRGRFGPVRNQGGRPTCIAFAASDTHSFARGSADYLSVEYAFYHAVRRQKPADPTQGVSMPTILDAISADGQPPEDVWPYLPVLPTPISSWAPPDNAAPIFRHGLVAKGATTSTIIAALDGGQPTLLAARISEQFHRPPSDYIVRPVAGDRDTGNHALIAVGHGTSANDTVILVRNSWGERWADQGYIWVTSEYLASRLFGIATPF